MSARTTNPVFIQWDSTDDDAPRLIFWSSCREHRSHMGDAWTDPANALPEAEAHMREQHPGVELSILLPCTGDDGCKGTEHIDGCYATAHESADSEETR
ncbi:hypothetical protein [Leifsonia aquatica]|uniref:hypothetical protein n=1 Tax=Leifsonia aquatica TaxID=144185 RepID=UPI0038219883